MDDDVLTFWAWGTPRPKGSMRHVGNGRMIEQSEHSKDWREQMESGARQGINVQEWAKVEKPHAVYVQAVFKMPRPKRLKAHDHELHHHVAAPDSDKLFRNLADAMTDAGVYHDDSQIADMSVIKRYAYPDEEPGVFAYVGVLK